MVETVRRLRPLPGGHHLFFGLRHANAWVLLAVIVILVAWALYSRRRDR
jgi:hypothetical protein